MQGYVQVQPQSLTGDRVRVGLGFKVFYQVRVGRVNIVDFVERVSRRSKKLFNGADFQLVFYIHRLIHGGVVIGVYVLDSRPYCRGCRHVREIVERIGEIIRGEGGEIIKKYTRPW